MFEKKVLITFGEERKVVKKRIYGKEIQMYSAMTEQEMIYCLREALNIYYNDNFESDGDAFLTPLELFSNLDILVLQLCTNIDVTNISLGELSQLNIHKFFKDNLGGFDMLEQAALVGVQHIHTVKLLEGFDHVASLDDLEQSTEDVQKILEGAQSDQLKDILATQIANNPTLAKFYEQYESVAKGAVSGVSDK